MVILEDIVDPDERLQVIAAQDDFRFLEGPVWNRGERCLYFTDIQASVIRRWRADGSVEEWRRPSNMANGLTYGPDGALLVCEHVPPGIRRIAPDGTETVLASHFEGKELNSPNDVVARSDGTVYFTDPPSGRTSDWGVERPQELDFQGVFRIDPKGELHCLARDYEVPNGLCLSPDESILYVNDTVGAHVRAYDVAADGSVSGERLFAEGITTGVVWDGVPDGLKVDERGNVYCAGPGGVWVFDPDGRRIGVLEASEFITNFNWGGPDYDVLFLCGFKTLYRLPMRVRGSGTPGRS